MCNKPDEPGTCGIGRVCVTVLAAAGAAYGCHFCPPPNGWNLDTSVESPRISGTISRYEERTWPLMGGGLFRRDAVCALGP